MSKELKRIAIDNDYTQHFENLELENGKILNATRDFYYDYRDFHGEERFSIKEGKLDGSYECSSYNGHPSVAFTIKAKFKDGILDGPFLMENNGHIIKKGNYVNGAFHGKDNSKRYLADAAEAELRFGNNINAIQEKCLNQPKNWRFDDSHKTSVDNDKKSPKVPETGLKKYHSGINGIPYLKNLRTKISQFFSRSNTK